MKMKVRITLTEEMLGTQAADKKIHEEFIASKAPNALSTEEEVAALGVEEVVNNAMTIFPKDNGIPFLWDYQIKGFFKDACSMLARVAEKDPVTGRKKACNESSKLTAFKKVIDGMVFVQPRKIPLIFDGNIGSCQRPLRGQTAQGERIALANSETVPAGTFFEIDITCLSDAHEKAVLEWLDYGSLRGIGQWRNSGKGRFSYEVL